MLKTSRRRASKLVKLAVIGTPLFFYGCGVSDTTVIERRVADRVEVVEVYRPGWQYSPFYGGYVPLYVPLGGYVGPGYYSGGYRPSRTVVNNYVTTHRTTVVRNPPTESPVVGSKASTVTRSSSAAPSSGAVKSGGFGSTGRSSGTSGT